MAGSVNKVILVGNLGADPEVRQTNDGGKIVTFSLATTETWNDKASGERKERTEWHRVVIFNENLAGVAERFLHKGSKVYLEGQLQTRKWMDASQVERYTTEVVLPRYRGEITLLDKKQHHESDFGGMNHSRSAAGGAIGRGMPEQTSAQNQGHPAGTSAMAGFDDEIPF